MCLWAHIDKGLTGDLLNAGLVESFTQDWVESTL